MGPFPRRSVALHPEEIVTTASMVFGARGEADDDGVTDGLAVEECVAPNENEAVSLGLAVAEAV